MTLAELLAEAAADDPEVSATTGADGVTEYRVGTQVFAAIQATGGASFRLDPTIAAAARRTPDTSPSDRGPEWVLFAPVELDPHGMDRARAWFEAGARRAR